MVAACLQGDVSIAQVALQHGLNTNLVQTWIRKAKRQSQLPPCRISSLFRCHQQWMIDQPLLTTPVRFASKCLQREA
ncbi:transposase [Halomonas daqingensis]|uniref:Transposase n=1 Tax=Billgrantia desiderata TaxID=52021 RepID=A0ABS9B4R0_9GAMM|nr:transposase [Halomonas desiderata]MCE8046883.1 transposase [Halomonas desiderata]